ncbi:hypothetical protein ADL00_05075 [Streptomyces sp. AS58]|nr:hypothetical protein ADL00_05075 [Streptomyces sp. AS58]
MVAASAPAQTAWLKKYDVLTDEIALDFDHGFSMAEHLVEEGLLSHDSLPDLQLIDSIFDEMSDESSDRWTIAALIDDAGWGQARELPQQVLAREGADGMPPPDICVIR